LEFIFKAFIAFLATNLEELILLVIFYASGRFAILDIIKGQYLGFLLILTLSLVGSVIGHMLEKPVVSLFGLLLIYSGLVELWEYFTLEKEASLIAQPEAIKTYMSNQPMLHKFFPEKLALIAATTIGLGADNLGVYIPLMAPLDWSDRFAFVFLFLGFNLLLAFFAFFLTEQKTLAIRLEKAGRLGKPIVIVGLGVYLLYSGEVLQILKNIQ
jgi:cadmium resistance protein CadD (predicted permease)